MGRNVRMERSSNTAACCIPQAYLMKVMSIASVVKIFQLNCIKPIRANYLKHFS